MGADLENNTGEDKDQGQQEEEQEERKPVDPAKRRRNIIILIVALVVIVAGGVLWYLHSQTYESTDDAQVDGHLNPIASRVMGTVAAVYVENNQRVEAGKPLVDLDPSTYQVSLAQSQAAFDQAVGHLRSQEPTVPIQETSNASDLASAQAEVANAGAALASAEHDYQSDEAKLQQAEATNGKAQLDVVRYKQLLDKREVAQSDYDQYDSTAKADAAQVASAKAEVASAAKTVEQKRAQLKQQQAKLVETVKNAPRQVVIKKADVQQQRAAAESSAAQVKQAQLNLSYCHIVAPVSGIVTQRSAEVGASVAAGQQLMMVVQTRDLWVTANFKETQLKKVRPGQHVSIKIDGLDKTFDGYVESMPASTGDRTSALPPENATGNYVKIVQRMPVRIRFNAKQQGLDDLRPGMSAQPKVQF